MCIRIWKCQKWHRRSIAVASEQTYVNLTKASLNLWKKYDLIKYDLIWFWSSYFDDLKKYYFYVICTEGSKSHRNSSL